MPWRYIYSFENGTAPPTAPAVIRKNTGTPKRSGSNSKTTTPRKKQKTNTEKKIEPLSPPLSVPPKDRNARAETITDNDDDNGGASVSGGSIAGGGVQQKQRAAMMREKKRKMMDEDDDDGDDSSAEDEGALDAARQLVWDSEEEDNIWL